MEGLCGAHSQPGPEGPAVRGQGETAMTPLARPLCCSLVLRPSFLSYLCAAEKHQRGENRLAWRSDIIQEAEKDLATAAALAHTIVQRHFFFSFLSNTAAEAEALVKTRKKSVI